MGWTGYPGYTAEEAKNAEVMCEKVLAKQGNWWIVELKSGEPRLIHFLTQRSGKDLYVYVKTLDVNTGIGPIPTSIARKYMKLHDGDFERAGGINGAADLEEAVTRPRATTLKKGDHFTVTEHEGNWRQKGSVLTPVNGRYTYISRFLAMRSDGHYVRLPKNWRRTWTWTKETL